MLMITSAEASVLLPSQAESLKPQASDRDNMDGVNILESMLVGALRGATRTPLEHPFDVIKTRWQAHPEFRSAFAVVSTAYREGGIKEFYSGAMPSLLRSIVKESYRFPLMVALPHVLNDFIFDPIRRFRLHQKTATLTNTTSPELQLQTKVATGISIALVESIIGCPFEKLKVLLITRPKNLNSSDVAKRSTVVNSITAWSGGQGAIFSDPSKACATSPRPPNFLTRILSQSFLWGQLLPSLVAINGTAQTRGLPGSADIPSAAWKQKPRPPREPVPMTQQVPSMGLFRFLFQGFSPLLCRQILSWVTFLATDAQCRAMVRARVNLSNTCDADFVSPSTVTASRNFPAPLSPLQTLEVSIIVGLVNTAVILPVDAIKTRMQLPQRRDPSFLVLDTRQRHPPNMLETFRTIVRQHGLRGFYVGFHVRLVHYIVSAMLSVPALEYLEQRNARRSRHECHERVPIGLPTNSRS